jgi:hypothetical protein
MKAVDLKPTGPGPIWRGIGCLLIVLIPIISFAAADLSLPFFIGRKLVPEELLITPKAPEWMGITPVLEQIFNLLLRRRNILATLSLTFIYILAVGGVLSVLYAYLYRLAAPPRYGPMDAPPPRVKIKKYKR